MSIDGESVKEPSYDGYEAHEPIRSLKQRLYHSSAITVVGFGCNQALRLGGNLLLTRLLFPEAFGVMALVNVFLQGLGMFSDVGLNLSIVQNPRGADSDFLNTVWTIQIFRGAFLWFMTAALAFPCAAFFKTPELAHYLPVAGLGVFLQGLSSTNLNLTERRLELGRRTLIELMAQFLGLMVMALLAWKFRNVWALVAGGITNGFLIAVFSHAVLSGPRMRILMDREIAREVLHFGKWIFISTVLTFITGQADRIILGKFMDMEWLGVYSVAFFLSSAVTNLFENLSSRVIFPTYSNLAGKDNAEFRRKMFKVRLVFLSAAIPVICMLILWGNWIPELLYDDRYHEAGWMLQVLAIGSGVIIIQKTISPAILAHGDSFRQMVFMSIQSTLLVSTMIGLGLIYGAKGIIFAIVIARFLNYFVLQAIIRPYRLWQPILDIPFLGLIIICGSIAISRL